jgi:hypothetical protein
VPVAKTFEFILKLFVGFDPIAFAHSEGRYQQIEISALSSAQIDGWKKCGIVLLLGSYISTFFPSNLPSGAESVRALWSFLFSEKRSNGKSWPGWLHDNFSRLPFEVLMQNCPDEQRIRESIQKTFGIMIPNPVHQFLADQLNRGSVQSIITTNYDLCFEAVFKDKNELGIFWDEKSWEAVRSIFTKTGKAYWKIHGSAEAGTLDSLVFDQQGERQMDPWKQSLLKDLLFDKTLVILGYSGSDFEICPQLAVDVRPKHVVWLQPNCDVTLNAKRVLGQHNGTLVIGDLNVFLTTLFGSYEFPVVGNGSLILTVDPALIPQWRVQTLNSMGCGQLMLDELQNLPESPAIIELRSAAYANIGKYSDAIAERKRKWAALAFDPQSKLQCELDIASSKFIYGSHIVAWREVARIEKEIRAAGISGLLTDVAEIRLMMAMRLGQISERTRTGFFFTSVRRKAVTIYEDTRHTLARRGKWGKLHGLRLSAQRLGIISPEDGRELTLPALESYLSVGYMIMVCISIRDEIRNSRSWRLSPLQRDACLWAIKMALRYHWKHEEWKFRWLLLLRSGGKFRWRHLRSWWRAFKSTQYTRTGRLMQIIFNSIRSNQRATLL